MQTRLLAFSATLALATTSLADVTAAATADPFKAAPVSKAARKRGPIAVTIHPGGGGGRGGWGGPEWYTKGWGGWGWGYGAGQGLLAGALVSAGQTAPYYDFTFGYPTPRRPYGYPYTAFPYGIGYPYYTISYGYYRPPSRPTP
ncbi:MAG: hypothetical protein J2P53_06765 [Bradyrhizobiaceae bacterium]|nr:hypothetical protein [Bradyrhizobiaceae bacterium]